MEERVRILGGVLNTGFAGGFRVFASVPKHGPVPDRLAVSAGGGEAARNPQTPSRPEGSE
jgi:hypothetical protein